MSTQDQFNAIH
jgi:hypothetical protein